jgi:hypothetical protein
MDVDAEFVYADILRTLQNSILNSNVSCLVILAYTKLLLVTHVVCKK